MSNRVFYWSGSLLLVATALIGVINFSHGLRGSGACMFMGVLMALCFAEVGKTMAERR
jgi:hypothetical protein